MIAFEANDTWKRFGEKYKADKDRRCFDLSEYRTFDDVLKGLGNEMRGRSSPILQTGQSSDAFIDVFSDWLEENWDNLPEIHLINWNVLSREHAERFLVMLYSAFHKVMWGFAHWDKNCEKIEPILMGNKVYIHR